MKPLLLAILFFPFSAVTDTIYHCKGFDGGTFWASTTCSNHKGLIDRIANVPPGMAWNQQVEIAERRRNEAVGQRSVDSVQSSEASRCTALKSERDKIWSRYSNWQYQAPAVVGSDRQRTLAIQAEQQSLGCATQ